MIFLENFNLLLPPKDEEKKIENSKKKLIENITIIA